MTSVLYSQRDPRWAHERLGLQDGATIGQYGCYTTTQAMIASDYGHTITPLELDQVFTDNAADPYNRGGYVDNDLCWDGMLAKVYSDFTYLGVYNCGSVPCDMSQLQPFSAEGMEAILELDFDHNPNDDIQTHFVRMFDYNNGDPIIDDPWYGDRVRFSTRYGSPAQTIQKVVKYQHITAPVVLTPTPPVVEVAPAPEVAQPTGQPNQEVPVRVVLPTYQTDYVAESSVKLLVEDTAAIDAGGAGSPVPFYTGQKLELAGYTTFLGDKYYRGAISAKNNQWYLVPATAFGESNQNHSESPFVRIEEEAEESLAASIKLAEKIPFLGRFIRLLAKKN